jgi:hypothetical protein
MANVTKMTSNTLTAREIKTLDILCDKENWNYINMERRSDKEFDITISGESGKEDKWKFSAWMPLIIIKNVDWTNKKIWSLTDAYGEKGYIPSQGYDWSGVRDSSTELIWKMLDFAIKMLEEDAIRDNIEMVLEST